MSYELPEARRRLRLFATCAIFEDEGGINRFETWVTPQDLHHTMYWECYCPRTSNPLAAAAARAAFWTLVVPLLWTEDRRWTGQSSPAILGGRAMNLGPNDAPLGEHLRRFVAPMEAS